jgi:hypothetical protein
MSARPVYRDRRIRLPEEPRAAVLARKRDVGTGPAGLISWRAVAAASVGAWLCVGGLTVAAWALTHRSPQIQAALPPLAPEVTNSVADKVAEVTHLTVKAPEPAPASGEPVSFKKAPASPPLQVAEEVTVPRETELPASELLPGEEAANLRTYGTQVAFVSSPAEAARKALKERKLLFVLHLSGNFEDRKFT